MVIYHVISYTIMTTQITKQVTNANEALEAVSNALIEAIHYLPEEMSNSGHKQVCFKASMLNAHLGSKIAVTSLYIRV